VRPNGSIEPVCRKCRTDASAQKINAGPMNYLRNVLNKARYGAKKRNLEFNISLEDVMGLWASQGGKCALSGVLMTHAKDGKGRKDLNVSLDRIDPDSGYVSKPMNVQLVCYRVNIMKHTLPEHELLWWVGNIVEKNLN